MFVRVFAPLLALLLVCLTAAPVLAEIEIPCPLVSVAPVLDGASDDAAWQNVKPVPIADTASKKTILLRSVRSADRVFFLVQFPDAAQNFLHKPKVWNATTKQYETGPHREDTFVFKWNMMDQPVNLSNFSDDSYRADVWYWKANRTNPAGYADDKTQLLFDKSEEVGAEEEEDSTELVSASGKKHFLIRKSDAGKPPYSKYKPGAYEGDLVDAYPPAEPAGSRADVHAKGAWQGGMWTIEVARALNTGHDDDVQFDPASGKPYLFGVSIFSLYGRKLDISTPNLYGMGRISEPLLLSFK